MKYSLQHYGGFKQVQSGAAAVRKSSKSTSKFLKESLKDFLLKMQGLHD
jgi:hypothetical protein